MKEKKIICQAPGGIKTINHLFMRHVLYLCAATAASHHILSWTNSKSSKQMSEVLRKPAAKLIWSSIHSNQNYIEKIFSTGLCSPNCRSIFCAFLSERTSFDGLILLSVSLSLSLLLSRRLSRTFSHSLFSKQNLLLTGRQFYSLIGDGLLWKQLDWR